MRLKALLVCAALLLASCNLASNWHLMDSGYSIDTVDGRNFAIEVHVNQLKQLGGDVNGVQFHRFVAEQLRLHDLCPSGWVLACIDDSSCVQRTSRSVTVPGRCAP